MSVKIRLSRDYSVHQWDDYDRGRVAVLLAVSLSILTLTLPAFIMKEWTRELDDTMDLVMREMKEFKEQTDTLWDDLLIIQEQYGRPPFVRTKRMAEFNFLQHLERRSMKGRSKSLDKILGFKPKEGYDENDASEENSSNNELKHPNNVAPLQLPNKAKEGHTGYKFPNVESGKSCKPVYKPECPSGPPGPIGKPGYDGIAGLPGAAGARGASFGPGDSQIVICPGGVPGVPGPRGEKGVVGPPGAPGYPGEALASTIPGPPGEPGEPGEPGAQGIDGLDGKDGQHATKWLPGEKGEKGAPGVAGDRGPPGTPGPNGEAGPPGVIGAIGDIGAAGRDGVEGPPGEPGYPGLTGRTINNYCPCPNRTNRHTLSKKVAKALSAKTTENIPKYFWLL